MQTLVLRLSSKNRSPKILLETIHLILENDTLPAVDINDNEQKVALKSYSLETLKEFLGNDDEALKEVLKSFIESTNENLAHLEIAVTEENVSEINAIAHRIAPMFNQIEAYEIGGILKVLDKNDFEISDLKDIFKALKAKTESLFKALQKEIV